MNNTEQETKTEIANIVNRHLNNFYTEAGLISDEDLIKIAEIKLHGASTGDPIINRLFIDNEPCGYKTETIIKIHQYLQSKGYKLPIYY